MQESLIIHRLFDEYNFGVVDPLVYREEQLEAFAELPKQSLAPAILKEQADILPYLIDISVLSTEQRYALQYHLELNEAQKKPSGLCALIASKKSAKSLINHLSEQLIRNNIKNQRILFRYHDPRVWHQLQWILDKKSIEKLMGSIDKWMYSLNANWHVTTKDEVSNSSQKNIVDKQSQPLHIERISLINRAIELLIMRHGYRDELAFNLGFEISQAIVNGQSKHLITNEDSSVAYAVDYIRLGAKFDEHPDVAKALFQLQEPEISYQEAMSDLDPSIMNQMIKTHQLSKEGTIK